MGRVRFMGILAALVGLSVASAAAHHSFSAEYDSNKPLKLTGKVVEMRYYFDAFGFFRQLGIGAPDVGAEARGESTPARQ